jgi:sirohydrochlorin ferrochelatase
VAELAPEFLVEPCFLELAEPDIPSRVEQLLTQGVRQLSVAPLLLFAAGHAKRDIPEAVEKAVSDQQAAGMKIKSSGTSDAEDLVVDYIGALECHQRIVELSAQRYAEALAGKPEVSAADTLLVLVGRGSSDADAIRAMERFAQLRAEGTAVARAEVCFVAVATPKLEEGLDSAARSAFRRIVVQPHLLFQGEVLGEIAAAVDRKRHEQSGAHGDSKVTSQDKEWILTEHLGASPLVAQAVVDLAQKQVTAKRQSV